MRPLTVEHALAVAHQAGATFRITGERVAAHGLDRVPPPVLAFLRERRDAVFTALGGSEQDRPAIELLTQLGASLVYCTDDAAAEAAVAEVVADAGDRPIAVDFETTPRPEYASPLPLRMTVKGRPMKVQPRVDDKAGLDPYRSDPRLVQLYGGGTRVAVLDMRRVAWAVLAPLWDRPLLAHNAQFELAFLARRSIHPQMHCSMQAAGLLLGVRRRSLAEACSAFLGLVVVKTHQRSDWGAATLSPGQLAYAAADAVLSRRLWLRAASELKAKGRDQAYRLQRNCLAAAAVMGLRASPSTWTPMPICAPDGQPTSPTPVRLG